MVNAPVTFCHEFVRRLPFERQGTYTELQWYWGRSGRVPEWHVSSNACIAGLRIRPGNRAIGVINAQRANILQVETSQGYH